MEASSILVNAVLLAGSLVALDRFSYAVITGAEDVSRSARIGLGTIGFVFVAFSTSLPEISVSLFAVLEGSVGLSIGNVLGSNIANVCLIVGLPVVYGCISGIEPGKCSLNLKGGDASSLFFGLFISSVLPLLLVRNVRYSRLVGVALFITFLFYGYRLSRTGNMTDSQRQIGDGEKEKTLVKGVLSAAMGIAGVVVCGYILVYSATNLAEAFSLSQTLIGATLIAVGTSFPELAVAVKSIQRGHMDFLLGNAVGSCFANLTVVLGLTLIFAETGIRMDAYFDLVFFSLISNLCLWYFLSRLNLRLKEGLILLAIYAIFITEFIGIFTFFK
ncbi:MAG: sodium:calcium antiporter [Candidatus Bathyarchaeia archaeon]